MKTKIKKQLLTGLRTTHACDEILEQQRMANPAHTDYESSKISPERISSLEKLQFKFIRTTERMLREFGISYDYIQTDFLFHDQVGNPICMWMDSYDGVEDHIFVGTDDKDEYWESFNNELDAVNYVYRELSLPGQS